MSSGTVKQSIPKDSVVGTWYQVFGDGLQSMTFTNDNKVSLKDPDGEVRMVSVWFKDNEYPGAPVYYEVQFAWNKHYANGKFAGARPQDPKRYNIKGRALINTRDSDDVWYRADSDTSYVAPVTTTPTPTPTPRPTPPLSFKPSYVVKCEKIGYFTVFSLKDDNYTVYPSYSEGHLLYPCSLLTKKKLEFERDCYDTGNRSNLSFELQFCK